MLPALPSLALAPAPQDLPARPGLLRHVLATGRAVLEVLAEARELRRVLSRRYPFVDF